MQSMYSFLENISPNDWEYFAQDFLYEVCGFIPVLGPSVGPDLGKDLIVLRDGKTYIVTCKHSATGNKSIGISDDFDFSDRIEAHNADGIICFYLANISSSLTKQINLLREHGREIIVFDRNEIARNFSKMSYFTLTKYGHRFNFNIYPYTDSEIEPLICMICKNKNIIHSANITSSGGFLYTESDNLHFIYGCKDCFNAFIKSNNFFEVFPFIEMWQAFFSNNIINFRELIDELATEYSLTFSRESELNWSRFISYATQRNMPNSLDPLNRLV